MNSLSFFAALCLFLATIEYAIPKPLPFMRIGLANIPIVLSLYIFRRRGSLLLSALKMFLHLLFSKHNFISAFGLTIAGALANALAQIALSYFMLFGTQTRFIAPLLLLSALVSGTVLGLCTTIFMNESKWLSLIRSQV